MLLERIATLEETVLSLTDSQDAMAAQLETISSAVTVPQDAPTILEDQVERTFTTLKIKWQEPTLCPIPVTGYQMQMDDGKGGELKDLYTGSAMECTVEVVP